MYTQRMPKYKNISLNIKKLRIYNDLTQQALADSTGLSKSTIVQVEAGKYNITVSTLFKLAKQFHVKPEKLWS